ncbi:hypothetical protein CN354_00080 [Bacillus cereus]|nr:hypothetical protein CN354_00080 [Bacillus cereus]
MLLRKTKRDLHSFSLSVFTWHGAKKGTDRFYPWADPLFQPKRKVFLSVPHYIFISHLFTTRGYENKKRSPFVFSFCFHLAWG